jgi:hypothetical protein
MTDMKSPACDAQISDLAELCVSHLREEETLLRAAEPLVLAVKDAFSMRAQEAFVAALTRHQEFAGLLSRLHRLRTAFREALSRQMRVRPEQVTLSLALERVPEPAKRALAADAARIRRMADELAKTNYWISVHLRVHLDAYRRLLRDVTDTAAGSGRYGPAGKTESLDYRPLILIRG